jgi:hypothetical protein
LAMELPPQPGQEQERPEVRESADLPALEMVAVPVDDRQMGLF